MDLWKGVVEMKKELVFYNQKFEEAVRNELLIKDRPIYESDAINVFDLDLSEFYFDIEDCDTLTQFKNLEYLQISVCFGDLSFLSSLSKLTEIYLEYCSAYVDFDFRYLSDLKCLRDLTISGGDWSDIKLHNLELISDIENLETLALHEFGYVDLRPLQKMKQIKNFYCGYADEVVNYNAIGSLDNLESLTLIDFKVDNIEFFKKLPQNMNLCLCGMEFTSKIDMRIFDRFAEKDISEIIIEKERVI
jgi:hypothetical protein